MMVFNWDLAHMVPFVMMAMGATIFLRGIKLLRLIGWMFLWQLLTVEFPPSEDFPLMLAGFYIDERLYLVAMRHV